MGKYDDAIGEISVILSVDEVLNEDSANKVDKRIKEQTKEREIPLRINTDQALKDLEGLVKAIKNTSNNLANSISNGKSLKAIQNQINNYNELQHRIENIGDAIGKTSKEYKEAQKIINKTNKLISGTVISKKEPQKRQPKKQSITTSDDVIIDTTSAIVEQVDTTDQLVEVQKKQAKTTEDAAAAAIDSKKITEKETTTIRKNTKAVKENIKQRELMYKKPKNNYERLANTLSTGDNAFEASSKQTVLGYSIADRQAISSALVEGIRSGLNTVTVELNGGKTKLELSTNAAADLLDKLGFKAIESDITKFMRSTFDKNSDIRYANTKDGNYVLDTHRVYKISRPLNELEYGQFQSYKELGGDIDQIISRAKDAITALPKDVREATVHTPGGKKNGDKCYLFKTEDDQIICVRKSELDNIRKVSRSIAYNPKDLSGKGLSLYGFGADNSVVSMLLSSVLPDQKMLQELYNSAPFSKKDFSLPNDNVLDIAGIKAHTTAIEENTVAVEENVAAQTKYQRNLGKSVVNARRKGTDRLQEQTVASRNIKYYPINENLAKSANNANSHSDYIPNSATQNYIDTVNKLADVVEDKKKQFPDQSAKLDNLLDRFAKNYANYINKQNSIDASYPSYLVAGPAAVTQSKKDKQNQRRESNWKYFEEHVQSIEDKINNFGNGTSAIRGDDKNAIGELETKIDNLKSAHQIMLDANKYFKKHKTLDGFDGLDDKMHKEVDDTRRAWNNPNMQPFPKYVLDNSRAEIKRNEARLSELKSLKSSDGLSELNDIYSLVTDKQDMRIRISFEIGKPDQEVIDMLRGKAFKWSPKNNAWQRQLTDNAIYATKNLQELLHEYYKLGEVSKSQDNVPQSLENISDKYQRSFGKGVVSVSRKNTAALIEETSAAQGAITSYEELYAVLERYVDVARQLKPTTLPEMSEVESLMKYDVHSEDLKSTAKAIQARYKNVQSIKSSQKQGLSIYSHIDDDGKQKYEERIYSNTLKDAQNELDGAIYNSVYAYSDSIDEFLAEFTQKKVKNYVQELYNRFSELEKQDDAYRLEAESFNAPLEDIMNKISERIGATDYDSKQYQILDQLRYRANDVDRYTLSVEANHIGKLLDLQTPYKEIEANAKRIKSYDELCSAVERYNTLNKKAYAYAKGTYDTLNESEEMERRELLSRFSASGVDNLRDYSNFNQISNINKLAAAMNLGEIDETFAQLQKTQALIQDLRTRYDKQAFKDVFGDIEEVSIANASQIYDTLITKDQEHARQLAAAANEAERAADAAQKELAATTGTTQEKKKQVDTSSKQQKQTTLEDNTEDEPTIPTPLDIVEKNAEEALKILNNAQRMKAAIANYANISTPEQLENEVRRTANEILGADLTMGATTIEDSRAKLELFNKELGITVKQVWQLQQEGDSFKFALDSTFAKQDPEKAQKYLDAQQKALDNSNKWANSQLAKLEKYQRNYQESSKKISGDTSLLNIDDTSMTADIDKTIDGLASHIESRIRSSMNTNIAQSIRNEIERDLDILNSEIAIQQMRKYSSSTMKPSEIEAIRKNFENTLTSIETKAKKDNVFDQVSESIQNLRKNLDGISDSPSVGKFVDDLRVLRSSVEVAKAQEQQLQSVLKVQNELYDATKKHEKLKINKGVNSSDATQQARVVDEAKKRYDTAKKLLSTEAQTAQILEREKVLQQEVQQLVAETQAQKAKKNAEAEAKARQEILDSFWENKFQNEYKYTNGKTSKDQVELDAMGNYYKKLEKDAKALEQQVAKVKKAQDDLYTTKLKYETLKTNGASEAELAAAQRLVSEKAKQLEIEFSLINAVKQREELTNRELTLQDELNNKVTAGMEAKMNSMNNTVNNKAGSLNGFGNVDGAQQAADALNNMADAQERFNQATTGLPAKRQAYNDFYQEYGNFNSNFDYAKNNNRQKIYDIKDTKKTYNELLKYANDINQINNTLTDLTLKDEGNGTYSNALQILEGKKNAILEDYVELQSAINKKFNTTNGIDAFLENAREKGALTSAEIERLNSLLREAGQISLDFYTKINSKLQPTFDKLSNLNDLTTSKKINNPDVAKQISDAYKAMDSKYQTFKENQDVQSAVDVMKFNNAMKEQVDLWYKAAQAEANYFANKRAYSADTTIGNVGDKARSSSNLNQDFTNMRESLGKAVQEFAGGEAIITGFRKSAEGIASLDFSVFDKGTNSMRQFTMEMGRMGQQAYITETSLSALEQSRKNASSQLSKSGSTWQSLQANNIDVNPDTAHSSVIKLREAMQQLQNVMQTSTEPKDIDKITRQAKMATAEVERLLSQSMKLKNTVGAEAIGSFKEDSTRMTDYDQLKAAVQSYAASIDGTSLKIGKYNEKQNELNYTLTTGDGRVRHYTASVSKLDKTIISQNTGVTRLKTGFQDLSGVVQMSAKRMLMFYAGYNIFSQVSRVMRQGVGYIKEIDAAMTELKKVTDETDASYAKFLSNAAKTGTQIGATTSEYVQAAANFARLGYSMNDAGDMGKSALVYKNVGDGISNVEEATNSIISTMKAFGIETGDTMSIVDKFNEVKVPASLYGDIYDKDGYIGKTLGTDNSEERFNGNYLFFK